MEEAATFLIVVPVSIWQFCAPHSFQQCTPWLCSRVPWCLRASQLGGERILYENHSVLITTSVLSLEGLKVGSLEDGNRNLILGMVHQGIKRLI